MNKIKKNRGFTLGEVLLVLAILAVAAALVMPAVSALKNSLRLREADDLARQLFLTAQNSLTAHRSAGTLARVRLEHDDGKDCYWIRKNNVSTEEVLPSAALSEAVRQGDYLVYYNAATATVLEVYYCREPLPSISGIGELQNRYGAGKNDRRAADLVGFYNGSGQDVPAPRPDIREPLVEIENGLELKVTVTLPADALGIGARLNVKVEEAGKSDATFLLADQQAVGSKQVYTYVLDSVVSGTRFGNLAANQKNGNPIVRPGADIKVIATVSAEGYQENTGWAECNSLFARVSGVRAEIANARHLRNLHKDLSRVQGIQAAVQTGEITWDTASFRPDRLSIHNTELTEYDGGGFPIRNLESGAGLFADMPAKSVLRNVRLVSPEISGTDHAGALIGTASGGMEISGCRVYAEPGDPRIASGAFAVKSTGGYAGGLIGLADAPDSGSGPIVIRNCLAAVPEITGAQAAGGLVGAAGAAGAKSTNCVITNSYGASGVHILQDGKWSWSRGLTGTRTGGLVGQSLSALEISNSYAVGAAAGGAPELYGGHTKAPRNVYWAMEGGDGSHSYGYYTAAGTRHGVSALGLLKRGVLQGLGGLSEETPDTYAYSDACKGVYPFFTVKGLPHYGDWPEQQTDGLVVRRNGVDKAWVMIPVGGRPMELKTAALMEGLPAKNTPVTMEIGPALGGAVLSQTADPEGMYTLTLTPGTESGMDFVQLKGGGQVLRLPVIWYRAAITMTGNSTGKSGSVTAGSRRTELDTPETETIGTLGLTLDRSTGTITAAISVEPAKADITAAITAWSGQSGYAMHAKAEDFAGWDQLKNNDPAVTSNGTIADGTNVLKPVGDNNFPGVNTDGTPNDGKLTVTGIRGGKAAVSARWAMDESFKATMDVSLEGAKARIAGISAQDVTTGRQLAENADYPLQLDVVAEPKHQVEFTFTPHLFGQPVKNAQYIWKVWRETDAGSELVIEEPVPVSQSDPNAAWSATLDQASAEELYRVTLEYQTPKDPKKPTGEKVIRSSDFAFMSVYREALKSEEAAKYIQAVKPKDGGGGFFPAGGTAMSVEQIDGGLGANQLTVQGYVDGAVNTRVKWSVYDDGGKAWKPLTDRSGQTYVFETLPDGSRRPRATVQWNNQPAEQYYNGIATGGSITITAEDAGEYDKDYTFRLRAEAVESTVNGTAVAAFRTFDVTVYRKLQIDPKSATVPGFLGAVTKEFTANRAPNGPYMLAWSWTVDGKDYTDNHATVTVKTDYNWENLDPNAPQPKPVIIHLDYGPYQVFATLQTKTWILDDFGDAFSATGDYEKAGARPSEKKETQPFLLVEKGKTEKMAFSWSTQRPSHISKEPDFTADPAFELERVEEGLNWQNSERLGPGMHMGMVQYMVQGKDYHRDPDSGEALPSALKWDIKQPKWDRPFDHVEEKNFTSSPVEIYVIGMDVLEKDKVVSDTVVKKREPGADHSQDVVLKGLGTKTTLNADMIFPSHLITGGSQIELTWESSNAKVVQFINQDGVKSPKATGESVQIIAERENAQGDTAILRVTATLQYNIGGKETQEWKAIRYVQVFVPPAPDMAITLEPCGTGDIPNLKSLYGLQPDAGSHLAVKDGSGTLTLIRDEIFGCQETYLKVRGTIGARQLNLDDYDHVLKWDNYFLDVEPRLSADQETLYLRVRSKVPAEQGHPENISVTIGSAPEQIMRLKIYETAQASLFVNSADVTNGSRKILAGEDFAGETIAAVLQPLCYDWTATDSAHPLDEVTWEMQGTPGYDPLDYLNMEVSGSQVRVTLKRADRKPDFRVIVVATSKASGHSSTKYALTFLPAEPAP